MKARTSCILLQYTMGDAKTIECCEVMDPSKGYMAARKLLKECFGHLYTINCC